MVVRESNTYFTVTNGSGSVPFKVGINSHSTGLEKWVAQFSRRNDARIFAEQCNGDPELIKLVQDFLRIREQITQIAVKKLFPQIGV